MTDKIMEKNLLELERRVKRLENELAGATYCYYCNHKKGQASAKSHDFNFAFNVHAFTYLKLKLTINASASAIDLILKINGTKAMEYKKVSGDYQLECVLPFAEGINNLTVTVKAESYFIVNDCNLETQGNLSYVEEEYLMQVANESERSIILTLIDKRAVISEYKSDQISTKLALSNVKGASLCRLGSNYLLMVIDDSNKCKAILLNDKIQKLNEQALAENIISVCSVGGETAKAFLVRGSTVYQYTVNADLTFSITSTGFSGKKVKSNPDVNSHIIIVDFNGNARLVSV